MNKLVSGLSSIEQILRRVIDLAGLFAAVILAMMMMLTVIDVFLRYFFNSPISGSSEYIEYLMVGTGFLGLAWCALKGAHVKVDLIVGKLSERSQTIADIINYIVILGLSALLAWRSFAESMATRQLHSRSFITGVEQYPFYLLVTLGCLLLFLAALILLFHSITKVVKK